LSFYDEFEDEVEARWLAGGQQFFLCEMPLSVLCGFVTHVMMADVVNNRTVIYAWLDGKKTRTDKHGVVHVVDSSVDVVLADGEVVEAGDVPDWWFEAESDVDGDEFWG
jgi:hypothetical protein